MDTRRLTLSPPFPFAKREHQDKIIFGDKINFGEIPIKPEMTDRKSGFRFEHLATEFENKMDENDSGIGKHRFNFNFKLSLVWSHLEPFLVNDK